MKPAKIPMRRDLDKKWISPPNGVSSLGFWISDSGFRQTQVIENQACRSLLLVIVLHVFFFAFTFFFK